MEPVAGLWIDHRKAIIVTFSDKGEKTQQVLSNVEKQLGRFDGKRSTVSYEPQMVQADDRQQRGFTKHLKVFYENVLSCIRDVHSVLVFGPGEAKGELRKLMERDNHPGKVVVVKSADKMTDRQIAAKVRLFHLIEKEV